MSPSGLNCSISVIRWLEVTDDEVGGSNPTGTVLHQHLQARLEEDLIDSSFFQQGLETTKTFSGQIWGHELQLREQDEILVVSPPNHKYYNKRFRIKDARYDSRHPGIKQNYVLVKLTRSQISHSEPYQ